MRQHAVRVGAGGGRRSAAQRPAPAMHGMLVQVSVEILTRNANTILVSLKLAPGLPRWRSGHPTSCACIFGQEPALIPGMPVECLETQAKPVDVVVSGLTFREVRCNAVGVGRIRATPSPMLARCSRNSANLVSILAMRRRPYSPSRRLVGLPCSVGRRSSSCQRPWNRLPDGRASLPARLRALCRLAARAFAQAGGASVQPHRLRRASSLRLPRSFSVWTCAEGSPPTPFSGKGSNMLKEMLPFRLACVANKSFARPRRSERRPLL